MKKKTIKSRARDVIRTIDDRRKFKRKKTKVSKGEISHELRLVWKSTNDWIDKEIGKGLRISHCTNSKGRNKNRLAIHLPARMDFSNSYDITVQYISAIRKLANLYNKFRGKDIPSKAYKLGQVNFDELHHVSTSAALVLTAEISKWDTSIRRQLTPLVDKWDEGIFSHFDQLGFFDLFDNKPEKESNGETLRPDLNFVRYVRGQCDDSDDAKAKKKKIKAQITNLVGDSVPKWTFLHGGLTEAVTNVTHHAYPGDKSCSDKSWYLTGSFNEKTKDMKIAFYDQGIGIPNSLPESEIWEKVLSYFSKVKLPFADQKRHSALLKAAVSLDRTSTEQSDRGKGLQDLLTFIRERGEGYLSILSYKGLYKCTISNGVEVVKSESFTRPLCGTLIIWSVNLHS